MASMTDWDSPADRHRPELDGIRAAAIGLVLLFHMWPIYLPGGWIGVDIFFVLSGYLITSILVAELDRTGTIALPRFYVRRALRLFPALTLLLVVVAVIEFGILGRRGVATGWPIAMAGSYLMNWNRAFEWGGVGALGHTWSLAIEEQFYLLWPLLLLAVPRRARLKGTAALLLAVLAWRGYHWAWGGSVSRIFNGFDTHADSLLAGCLLAQMRTDWRIAPVLARLWFIPVGAIAEIMMLAQYDSDFAVLAGFPVASIIAVWLIVAGAQPGPLRFVLTLGPSLFIGRISYGIYLWHDPMLVYLRGYLPYGYAFLPVMLAIAIAIASHFWLEQPFLRLKNRLAGTAIEPPRSPGPAAPVSLTA